MTPTPRRDGVQTVRKIKNRIMISVLLILSLLAVIPLLLVFGYVILQGLPALSPSLFTELPKPVGEAGGGMANAILGTGILIGLASLVGIPIGILSGVYLSEYPSSKLSASLRFVTDVLASIPSIIIGIFAYGLLVVPLKRFSAYAGGAALAIIMIPTIARTTEEILKLVPAQIREAGLGLGLPRWKVTLSIVLRGSRGGIVTGIMLAVARASGETAPLLFTALNNQFWSRTLDQPIASIPVQIYTYAISPYEDWHAKAWAGAFLLVLFVFVMNLLTRILLQRQPSSKD